jgi:hypothetical protein
MFLRSRLDHRFFLARAINLLVEHVSLKQRGLIIDEGWDIDAFFLSCSFDQLCKARHDF